VLIFSQFKIMLDILEDFLTMRGYKYCRLDGDTDLQERETQIEDFSRPDSDKVVFLISTRAGGLGINLVSANHVVIYDSDFNP
jgi:SWI/SNF-related matrix-associated actin-dependent regulator of chromatin subfamily A member 5